MSTFQKLLIFVLFFIGLAIFYFASQLNVVKPTVVERCFSACKTSPKLKECNPDILGLEGDRLVQVITQSADACDRLCLGWCQQYPNPEYFQ